MAVWQDPFYFFSQCEDVQTESVHNNGPSGHFS